MQSRRLPCCALGVLLVVVVLLCMQVPCLVDISSAESSHATTTRDAQTVAASSAAKGFQTDTSELAEAIVQAIASQAEASITHLAHQTDMLHLQV